MGTFYKNPHPELKNPDNGLIRLNPKYMRELFTYDETNGELRWNVRPLEHFANEMVWKRFNKHMAGKISGRFFARNDNKYIAINVQGQAILAHRVAWAIYYNEDPAYFNIIAKDNNLQNIKIDNLEKVSFEEKNRLPTFSKKIDGLPKNISFINRTKKYRVNLVLEGKNYCFGHYDQVVDALHVIRNIRDVIQNDCLLKQAKDIFNANSYQHFRIK